MDKPAELEDRLIDFAVRIINVVEALPSAASRKCYGMETKGCAD